MPEEGCRGAAPIRYHSPTSLHCEERFGGHGRFGMVWEHYDLISPNHLQFIRSALEAKIFVPILLNVKYWFTVKWLFLGQDHFQTLLFSNSMRYHLTLMLRLTSYHTLRLYVDIWRINVDARANDLM
ncbi:hypothetical protein OSTOST_21445 [Ostertagia ostertagi]